jgi:hypothetical protein
MVKMAAIMAAITKGRRNFLNIFDYSTGVGAWRCGKGVIAGASCYTADILSGRDF